MNIKITVTPAPGLLVLNPATGQALPSAEERPSGTRVPLTSYWYRRLTSGDVTEIAEASPPETSAESASEIHSESIPDSPPENASTTSEATASKPSKPKDK